MALETLTIVDYAAIAFIAFPTIMGIFKGFFQLLFRLLGTVAGLSLAIVFTRPVGDLLKELLNIKDSFTSRVVACILIYFSCWIAGILIGFLIKKFFSTIKLGWMDRLFGAFLGFFEGLVMTVVFCVIMMLIPDLKAAIVRSKLVYPAVNVTVAVVEKLPHSWQRYLDPQRWIGIYKKRVLDMYRTDRMHRKTGKNKRKHAGKEHSEARKSGTKKGN